MGKTGDVTEAKMSSAPLPIRGQQHQPGCNPGQPGNVEFGEGRGQQKSRDDGNQITRSKPRKKFHPAQLARKLLKRKLEIICRSQGISRKWKESFGRLQSAKELLPTLGSQQSQ